MELAAECWRPMGKKLGWMGCLCQMVEVLRDVSGGKTTCCTSIPFGPEFKSSKLLEKAHVVLLMPVTQCCGGQRKTGLQLLDLLSIQ